MSPKSILCAASCLLAACSEPPAPSKTALNPSQHASASPLLQASASAPAASHSVAAPPAPAPLPASAKGINGAAIRVEEKDGFRWLLIDDVVHAAMRIDKTEDPLLAMDPIASIFEAVQPSVGEVLVIGLGSGATVNMLRDTHKKVDAVEIEPAVIDFARKYFGFQGDAILSDGAAYLKANKKIYGAIVLDAFAGKELPASLLQADVLKAFRDGLDRNGFGCIRMMGRPSEPRIFQVISAFAQHFASVRLFGTGAGDTEQHLYLVVSERPYSFQYMDHGFLWPIPLPDSKSLSSNSGQEALKKAVLGQLPPKVRLAGYLTRGDKDPKEFFLDLPHWEMGSRRYALKLSEADAKKLNAMLPPKTVFPTSGDLSSDGDLTKTLHSMMGGGGVKLSLVRFSPVVVAVEGALLPLPEDKESKAVPKYAGVDELPLNRGPNMPPMIDKSISKFSKGTISVEKMQWSIDLPAFKRLRASKVLPRALKMESAARKADFAVVEQEALSLSGDFAASFGGFWPRIGYAEEYLGIREIAGYWAKKLSKSSSEFEYAKACDWAAFGIDAVLGPDYRWAEDSKKRESYKILKAFQECAEQKYSIVLNDKSSDIKIAEIAASRVVSLLEEKLSALDENASGKKALELTLEMLKGRVKNGKAMEEPPPF